MKVICFYFMLQGLRGHIEQLVLVLYCFCNDLQLCHVKRVIPTLTHPTAVKIYQRFRDLVCEAYDALDIKMGDGGEEDEEGGVEGGIVEIDESKFGKIQKYKKGKQFNRYWVFGLTERRTRKVYLVQVNSYKLILDNFLH